jgi:GAF domain-containing protein
VSFDAAAADRTAHDLAAALAASTSSGRPSVVLGQVLDAAQQVLSADGVGLLLLDDAGVLRAVGAATPLAERLETVQARLGVGPGIDCVDRQDTVSVDDLHAYESLQSEADLPKAVLAAPVRVNGQVVGNLNVVSVEQHTWTEAEINAACAFASVVSELLRLSAGPAPRRPDGGGANDVD